jgi:hypothetical protein
VRHEIIKIKLEKVNKTIVEEVKQKFSDETHLNQIEEQNRLGSVRYSKDDKF